MHACMHARVHTHTQLLEQYPAYDKAQYVSCYYYYFY